MKIQYSKHIVNLLIDALNDRAGFDHWWWGIDEEIQKEIIKELAEIVKGELDK